MLKNNFQSPLATLLARAISCNTPSTVVSFILIHLYYQCRLLLQASTVQNNLSSYPANQSSIWPTEKFAPKIMLQFNKSIWGFFFIQKVQKLFLTIKLFAFLSLINAVNFASSIIFSIHPRGEIQATLIFLDAEKTFDNPFLQKFQ